MSTRNRLQTPDTTSPSITGDVRDLLGMNTRAASLVAGLFLVSLIAQLVVSVGNGSALLPGITVLVLVALSAVGLLTIPDDPATAAATCDGPWSVLTGVEGSGP